MMRLYLVRHGIAVAHGTPGLEDDERPLTRDGEDEMRKVAKGLKRLKVDPERILASPLPRALRTAEIVADRLDKEKVLETTDVLRAGQDARTICEWLATLAEASLMIVGHDPALSRLISLLVGAEGTDRPLCELEKGGVAAFRGGEDGSLVIDWIATPKMLRKLG